MHFDVDVEAGTVRIDGGPPTPWPDGAKCIQRMVFDTDTGRLQFGLPGLGELAEVETLAPANSVEDLRAGRPFLYLDQNQWRKIAEFIHGGTVTGNDAEAAAEIVRRVAARELLCPLSGGHFAETVPLYGDLRRKVVVAMLSVSRGWLMRNSLIVHEDEAFHIVSGGREGRPPVFSPDALIFTTDRTPLDLADPAKLVPLIAEVQRAMGAYEMLLEDVRMPVDKALSQQWADGFAQLARDAHQGGASFDVIRRAVGGNVAISMLESVERAAARAGVGIQDALGLAIEADQAGGRAPFTDFQAEYLAHRVRNVTQRWRPNDFLDTMFLTAAGAYADVVVCENNAANYMRQAARVVPCAAVATSLSEAIECLNALPASTAEPV